MPNTVRLHRVLATKPDKVYRAFIEADAMAKWLPPNGFICTVHHLDAKVGGTFRMCSKGQRDIYDAQERQSCRSALVDARVATGTRRQHADHGRARPYAPAQYRR